MQTIDDIPLLSPEEIASLGDDEAREYYQLLRYVDPVVFAKEFFGIEVWDKQAEVMRSPFRYTRTAIRSGQKVGKAQKLDTPIPTPDGWKTIGDLNVGDQVFDERGRPTRVIDTSEVFTDHDCYELEFDDGTKVVCDAGHKWLTWTSDARKAHHRAANPRLHPSVKTTEEIARTLVYKHRGSNHSIPLAGPVHYPEKDLPLHPYVLGAWLGGGHARTNRITTGDPEIVERFEALGYRVWQTPMMRRHKSITYCFKEPHLEKGQRGELLRLGVKGNKHIPDLYLQGSAWQRMELLKGLMDTDGYVNRKGTCQYYSTSERLARDVRELAASLGFKARLSEKRAKLNGRDCGPCYIVGFTPHEPVFHLARKLRRQHRGKTRQAACRHRFIVAARKLEPVPVKCISVANPSRLFLCSESFIPTHNSISAAIIALMWFHTKPQGRVILTSSSYNQIKNILWREVQSLMWKAEALGHPPFASRVSIDPETGIQSDDGERYIIGISTKEPEKMAGYSGQNLLFLVDEGSGVDDKIYDAMNGNLAGGGRMFIISNPTRTSGYFYETFKTRRESFHLMHISSEDTPNVREKRIVIPGLATYEYIQEKRREWGKDSPFYQVRILGEFPKQDENAVIPLYLVEEAQADWREPVKEDGALVLGVDPSRYGSDATVVQPVRGKYAYQAVLLRNSDGATVAGEVLRLARALRRDGENVSVNIDDIAVGSSPYDFLMQMAPDWLVVNGVSASHAASRPNEFAWLRDELWWGIREWLEDGGRFPEHARLAQELVRVGYDFDMKGRVKVEDKKTIRRKYGRSTDMADALALAVYAPSGGIHYEFWG